MEAENARLCDVAKSSTEQLEKANRLAAEAQKEAASLEELNLLKMKMKEEEQLKLET
jgi:hypothetical protein